MQPRLRFFVKFILLMALLFLLGQNPTLKALAQPLQAIAPFLYPPFFGRASEESIFDHSSPNYSTSDQKIVLYTGETLNKNCPNAEPAGVRPPNGICDAGYGGYWSYQLGSYIYYNGHDGVDYGVSYRPIIAAADADSVVYAGWADPSDHRLSLGIYVRLRHPNGYNTLYGHLSALAVQSCLPVGCANIPHGEIIGISGTTGNSSGPHLHFTVTDPQGRRIDPYGWAGVVGRDPLAYNQRESLWVEYPNTSASSGNVYPSGSTFTIAPSYPAGIIVDNEDPRFDQIPVACWTTYNTAQSASQNGQLLAVRPVTSGSDTCKARWKPSGLSAGVYVVSVRIPAIHATSEGALYTILHNGISTQVVVNQTVYPNVSVSDGWVYLGKYYFDGVSQEYVQLGNRTQDVPSAAAGLELGADAVRFSPVIVGTLTPTSIPSTPTKTLTPTITLTPTPSFTPTITRTFTVTNTLTVTRTFTATQTPSVTRTPTITSTPSITRTPSKTPTETRTPTGTRTSPPSATIRPTSTRWPTPTPVYNKINVYFANRNRLALNQPPYETTRTRYVRSSIRIYEQTLNAYFTGPGSSESYYYGDVAIYDGFIGYSKLEITEGVARVYLIGACNRQRITYTIAQMIQVNLKQYPLIQTVKIYDQAGQTLNPDGEGDSVPLCLDPSYDPTPTPTLSPTPTQTRTPTRTLTPTKTPRPSNTPYYNFVKVYFASNYRLSIHQQPYLVNGVRYIRSIYSVYNAVLDEYFKGPGSTEYTSYGYRALYDGFTGYERIEIAEDIARVYLKGVCQRQRPEYGIADLITANLKQFPNIRYVKIYDQNAQTNDPDGISDSLPACLLPTATPSP